MSRKRKKPIKASKRRRSNHTPKKRRKQVKKPKIFRDKLGRFKKPPRKSLPKRKSRVKLHRKRKPKSKTRVKLQRKRKPKRKSRVKLQTKHKPKSKSRLKPKKKHRGARKEQIKFLKEHGVIHEAYVLDHSIHFVDGEPVIGINADTLREITNAYREQFNRGIQFGRLIIEYHVGRGRGRSKLTRYVSTPRILLDDDDSYEEILQAFLALSIPLYEYDATYFGEDEETDIKIYIKKVHLELININPEASIELDEK